MRILIDASRERELRGTLLILLFLIGATALAAGYFFMLDPSGKEMGFSLYYIRFSPFADYFWPGWILFVFLGIYAMICLLLVIFRHRHYPFYVTLQGILLIGWIVAQIIMVRDFNLLHAVCLLIGAVFCITGKRIGYH